MKNWIEPIKRMGACEEALEWAEDYETLADALANCERGDWMLWLLGRLSGDPETDSRKKLVLTACQCARLALPYVKEGEDRPLKAIETAEAWARGVSGVSLVDVRAAANAAYVAANAAYVAYVAANAAAYAAANAAAYAAANAAAYAANAAAYAANAAANAAYAAANAAAYAAANAATLGKCADIVREHYDAPSISRLLTVKGEDNK